MILNFIDHFLYCIHFLFKRWNPPLDWLLSIILASATEESWFTLRGSESSSSRGLISSSLGSVSTFKFVVARFGVGSVESFLSSEFRSSSLFTKSYIFCVFSCVITEQNSILGCFFRDVGCCSLSNDLLFGEDIFERKFEVLSFKNLNIIWSFLICSIFWAFKENCNSWLSTLII